MNSKEKMERPQSLERAAEAPQPMTKEQMFEALYGPKSDYYYEDE